MEKKFKYKVGDKIQYFHSVRKFEYNIAIGVISSTFISVHNTPCYIIPTGKKEVVFQKRHNKEVEREKVHIVGESLVIGIIEQQEIPDETVIEQFKQYLVKKFNIANEEITINLPEI